MWHCCHLGEINLRVWVHGRGDGIVWFRCAEATFLMFTPHRTNPERMYVEEEIRSTNERHFKLEETLMPERDSRSKQILEIAARTELIVLNTNSAPTSLT